MNTSQNNQNTSSVPKLKYISRTPKTKYIAGKKYYYFQYRYVPLKKPLKRIKTPEEIKIAEKLYQAEYFQRVTKPQRAQIAQQKKDNPLKLCLLKSKKRRR